MRYVGGLLWDEISLKKYNSKKEAIARVNELVADYEYNRNYVKEKKIVYKT